MHHKQVPDRILYNGGLLIEALEPGFFSLFKVGAEQK
jgi:hypothetical protein